MSEQNILEELEKFYLDNPIKVWIPSLQEECKFRPISVGEQKQLIDLENNKGSELEYIVHEPKVLNSFMLTTCLAPDKAAQFTIIDRPAILLQLKHNIKSDIVLRINDELAEIDLGIFVDKLRKKKPGNLKMSTMVNVHNFLVHLQVPTLELDEFYNNYFLSLYSGRENVDAEEATGDAFMAEMSKFIRKIVFETSTRPATFDFSDTSTENFNRNMEILSRLPSTIVTRVTEFISQIKNYQIKLVTEKTKINGKSKSIFLDIDLPFFTTL